MSGPCIFCGVSLFWNQLCTCYGAFPTQMYPAESFGCNMEQQMGNNYYSQSNFTVAPGLPSPPYCIPTAASYPHQADNASIPAATAPKAKRGPKFRNGIGTKKQREDPLAPKEQPGRKLGTRDVKKRVAKGTLSEMSKEELRAQKRQQRRDREARSAPSEEGSSSLASPASSLSLSLSRAAHAQLPTPPPEHTLSSSSWFAPPDPFFSSSPPSLEAMVAAMSPAEFEARFAAKPSWS